MLPTAPAMQEPQPSISVTFEVTTADIRAFQRHARGVMPEYRRIRWFFVIFAALIAFQATATATTAHSLPIRVLTFLIVFGVIWLVMILTSRLVTYLIMAIRPNRNGLSGVLCEHTIAIDPEGITEVTPVNQGRHFWKGMYRVDSTADHIFLYIQQNAAHTIPRRFFASPEQADLFFRTATGYHRAATGLP